MGAAGKLNRFSHTSGLTRHTNRCWWFAEVGETFHRRETSHVSPWQRAASGGGRRQAGGWPLGSGAIFRVAPHTNHLHILWCMCKARQSHQQGLSSVSRTVSKDCLVSAPSGSPRRRRQVGGEKARAGNLGEWEAPAEKVSDVWPLVQTPERLVFANYDQEQAGGTEDAFETTGGVELGESKVSSYIRVG